jgi:hypothetical protein
MSIVSRHADLAYMLADSGVIITLGGASTSGLVRAADEEILQSSGSPVGLIGKAILVIIAMDSLPGLAGNAEIVVTAGALAGTYRVDRILTTADGEVTRFLACPTTVATAPPFWVRGTVLLPWERRGVGAAAGLAFNLATLSGAPVVFLHVDDSIVGTDPQLLVQVLECETEDGTFTDSGIAFEPVGENGDVLALTLPGSLADVWTKLAPVIAGTDDPTYLCGAVILDVLVPSQS